MVVRSSSWRASVAVLLAICIQIVFSSVAQAAAEITFSTDGKIVKTLDLAALTQALDSQEIEVENPYYVEDQSILKRYAAFKIQDVLDLIFDEAWKNGQDNVIVITAANAYKTEAASQVLTQTGGYLAYKDLDEAQGWQTLSSHGKTVDPGPFFLLWTGEAQTYDAGFPWSWQVVELELIASEK